MKKNRIFEQIFQKIECGKKNLSGAWAVFLIGILVHFFKLSNYMVNHDSVVLYGNNYDWLLAQGKWFVTPLSSLEARYLNISYLSMLIGIIAFTLSSILFCDAFKIQKRELRFLVGLMFVTFPSIAAMSLYESLDYFGCTFLLATSAGYFLMKERIITKIIGVTLLIFSLGAYQPFLGITLVMLVLDCLLRFSSNEKWHKVTLRGVWYVILSICGCGLYYVVLRYRLYITSTTLASYKGIDQMPSNLTPSVFFNSLVGAYKDATSYYFTDFLGIYGKRFPTMNYILLLLLFLLCIFKFWQSGALKSIGNLIMGGLMIFLLPLAVNVVGLLSANSTFYYISIAPFVMIFAAPVVLLGCELNGQVSMGGKAILIAPKSQKYIQASLHSILVVAAILQSINWIVQDNIVYYKEKLNNFALEAKMTVLASSIQNCEGYEQGCSVYIVGTPPYDYLITSSGKVMDFQYHYNTDGFGLFSVESTYSPGLIEAYFRNMLSMSNHFADLDDSYPWIVNRTYDMPVYPTAGSIKTIDDYVIVKLSNNYRLN